MLPDETVTLICSLTILKCFVLFFFFFFDLFTFFRFRSSSFDNSLINRQNNLNTLSTVPINTTDITAPPPSSHPSPHSQVHSLQFQNGIAYNTAIPYRNSSPVPGLPGQLRKASSAAALADKETNTEFYHMAHGGARTKDYRGSSNHLRVPSVTRSKTFSAGPQSPHMLYSCKVSLGNIIRLNFNSCYLWSSWKMLFLQEFQCVNADKLWLYQCKSVWLVVI